MNDIARASAAPTLPRLDDIASTGCGPTQEHTRGSAVGFRAHVPPIGRMPKDRGGRRTGATFGPHPATRYSLVGSPPLQNPFTFGARRSSIEVTHQPSRIAPRR